MNDTDDKTSTTTTTLVNVWVRKGVYVGDGVKWVILLAGDW